MQFIGAACRKIAVRMPAVEVAWRIQTDVTAALQKLETELQISEQSVTGVSLNSGDGGAPHHDIRWAANGVRHSAEAEIDDSAPRMRSRESRPGSLDFQFKIGFQIAAGNDGDIRVSLQDLQLFSQYTIEQNVVGAEQFEKASAGIGEATVSVFTSSEI